MLSALPLELRFRIFSYVLSTEDEGLIVVRATRRGDWATVMGLPPYATLLHDSQYNRYRGRRDARNKWPDLIEEAFHKGDVTPCSWFPRTDPLPVSSTMDCSLSTKAERVL